MPTGYVEFYSVLLTRREYSSLEKRHRQGMASLDHFDNAAFHRVLKKLYKNGWYEDIPYEKAIGVLNYDLSEWFRQIDEGYRIEKK
tara:strand:- start:108 stop:365 length:258 start_codon:yes stop_codon:yes gene_type:complete